MNFEIESGVPYHKAKRMTQLIPIPLKKMKNGDSIVLENHYDKKTYSRWYSRLKEIKKRIHATGVFKMGSDDKGNLRLWKI